MNSSDESGDFDRKILSDRRFWPLEILTRNRVNIDVLNQLPEAETSARMVQRTRKVRPDSFLT